MPHDDKHYQKLQRTFKFVFDALWLVAVVLIVGLLLIWLYDKIGGTFLPRPWKIVFLIIFAILAALTLVIVGHSPKREPRSQLTQNDLAGSAKLMNFFDAGIAIGRSAKDAGLRYIKQVKVRTGVNQYDGEKVLLCKLQQVRGYTQFVYEDTVCESDHLRPKNAFTEAEDLQELIDLQAQHKTVRQIAEETGFAPTTVHRKLKKAEQLGYKPSSGTQCPVPFQSCVEQAEQEDGSDHFD